MLFEGKCNLLATAMHIIKMLSGPCILYNMIVCGGRTNCVVGRRGYQCTQCFPPRTFIHRHDYVKHQWAHEDFRPVKCPRCEFTCRTTNNLKSHMLRHTEEKNYECHYCDKRFKSAQYLYNHEQVHTRERVFKCPKYVSLGSRKVTCK